MLNFKNEYFTLEKGRLKYPTQFKDKSFLVVYGSKEGGITGTELTAHIYKIPENYYEINAGQLDFSNYPNGIENDFLTIRVTNLDSLFSLPLNFTDWKDISPENLTTTFEKIGVSILDIQKRLSEVAIYIDSGKPDQINLPKLPVGCTWYKDQDENIVALPISDLYGKFQQMIDSLHKTIKDLLDIDYGKLSDNLKKELAKHLLTLEEALGKHKDSLDDYTLEKIEEIKATCDRIIGLAFSKLTKADTIEDLKTMRFLKVGDIVEVLGYYTAGDGANHKRVIANEDDGSGVQLANGLWANVAHNGEVNVSWFGATKNSNADKIEKMFSYTKANKLVFDIDILAENRAIHMYNRNNVTIDFNNREFFIPSHEQIFYFLEINNCHNVNMLNINFKSIRDKVGIPPEGHERPDGNKSSNVKALQIFKSSNIFVRNVKMENMESDIYVRGKQEVSRIVFCKNIIIENWYSRNASTNMFCDYTENLQVINIDSVLAPLVSAGDHNFYFSRKAKDITIINPKLRYSDGSYGNSFLCSNSEMGEDFGAKNLIVRGAEVYTQSRIYYGYSGTSATFYDCIFKLETPKENVSMIDNNGIAVFNNCVIESNQRVILSNDEKAIFEFNNCSISSNNPVSRLLWVKYPLDKCVVNNCVLNLNEITSAVSESGTRLKKLIIKKSSLNMLRQIFINKDVEFIFINNIYNFKNLDNSNHTIRNYEGTDYSKCKIYNNIFSDDVKKANNIFAISSNPMPNNGNIVNGVFKNFKTDAQQLNTPYMATKMKQEGVYNNFINYMDEKTAYDKKQRKLEEQRQLAYEQALEENPNLPYEEFMSVQPMTLNLVEEPQPSEALKRFMEKYL